jgi:hypothetical protein
VEFLNTIIAVFALCVSIWGTRYSLRVARQALSNANLDEKKELSRLLWETTELKKSIGLLDEWIWEKRVFTRKQRILDALLEIKGYWKRNDAMLEHFLGENAQTYQALRGLYDVALQNEDNQPPGNGSGEWKGVTEETLLGFKVEQLLNSTAEQLKLAKANQAEHSTPRGCRLAS